jgi:hypothetical protein
MKFRAESPLRNCSSKKNSIASELLFSKKKKVATPMVRWYVLAWCKNDCEDTGEGTKE